MLNGKGTGYKGFMVSDEEFTALKKQVELLQTNFNILATSYKNLYEVKFPEGMSSLATFIERSGDIHTQFGDQMCEVINRMGQLAIAIEVIQMELELKAQ